MPAETNSAVRADHISRTLYLGSAPISILQEISFTIPQGGWVALMGPSGSGKSTLLGIVAGLDVPTSGRLEIDGTDIAGMDERALARIRNEKIGMVFQSFNLIPTLTAEENVAVPLYVHAGHIDIHTQARQMLDRVGLGNRYSHRPNQLSGGEQQRVAIARALVTHPRLLVADEPTGNLDRRTGAQILELFAALHEELRLTILVATHDPGIASQADCILHLVDGRLEDAE